MSRIVFSLDKDSLEQLQKLTDERGFETMGETIRDAVRVYRTLGELADEGYTDVQARRGGGGPIKSVYIPRLHEPTVVARNMISRVNRLIKAIREL